MTNTCHFTQMAGLSIDWSETWFWATASSDARHISDMLVPFSSPHQVLRYLSANDLGYQLQYWGCGNILHRFENGLCRLARLTGMPHSLDVKEHLILSSVLPAALDAAETRPLSGEQTNFGQRWPLILNSGSECRPFAQQESISLESQVKRWMHFSELPYSFPRWYFQSPWACSDSLLLSQAVRMAH